MQHTRSSPPAPTKTTIHDTGVDPLESLLSARDGWARDDDGHWRYAPRDILIKTNGPGRVDRFECSIKASKPVTFGTRTGVEVWITTAGA